jgi:hypothetical protein
VSEVLFVLQNCEQQVEGARSTAVDSSDTRRALRDRRRSCSGTGGQDALLFTKSLVPLHRSLLRRSVFAFSSNTRRALRDRPEPPVCPPPETPEKNKKSLANMAHMTVKTHDSPCFFGFSCRPSSRPIGRHDGQHETVAKQRRQSPSPRPCAALRGEGFGVRGFIRRGYIGNHESKKTLICCK